MLAPSEIVQGEKSFSVTNGNTVDVSGVVTEGAGTDLTDVWLQANLAGTNRMAPSADLTGWIRRGTAAALYDAVGIDGTPNSATTLTVGEFNVDDAYRLANGFTAGVHTQVKLYLKSVNSGEAITFRNPYSAAQGAWVIDLDLVSSTEFEVITESHPSVNVINPFTPSGTSMGMLFAEAGGETTFIIGNAELHDNISEEEVLALPPIITTAAVRTISATNYTHNLANIDTDNSATAMEFKAEGIDVDLLTIGDVVVINYDGAQLRLNDNTSTPTFYPIAEGGHTVGLALGDSSWELTIDSVAKGVKGYTPLTPGTVATTATHFDLRNNLTNNFAESQQQIIDWNTL